MCHLRLSFHIRYNSAMNIEVHIFFLIGVFIFLDKYSGVELLGYMVVLYLIFQGISIMSSIVATPLYIPTNSAGGFPFVHVINNTYYLLSF